MQSTASLLDITALLHAASEPDRERETLAAILGTWREANALAGAAIYVSKDNGARRVVAVGDGSFPEAVDDKGDDETRRTLICGNPARVILHTTHDLPRPLGNDLLDLLLVQGAQLLALREEMRYQSFERNVRSLELEAVHDVNLAIASTLDLDEVSEGILLRTVALCDARRGALYLLDDGCYRLHRTIGGSAREEIAADDPQLDRLRVGGDDARQQDVLPGAQFPLVVSIGLDGAERGLLAVADRESRQGVGAFQDSDRRTLELFANQAAIALENARLHLQEVEKQRLEREMELAAEIQQGLLPEAVPCLPGYDVIGWSRPARHVGGDFYDFLRLGENHYAAVVADVTGKGMPASLMVSTIHSALHLLMEDRHLEAAVLSRLNDHIAESSNANKFITLLMAELEPKSGALRIANAGHNPGLLVRRDGSVEELPAHGLPLGLMAHSAYTIQETTLGPGDLLCLYSDGITECAAPDDEEYGLERFRQLLVEVRSEPVADVIKRIDREMLRFAAGSAQSDDQTVVLARREE